MPSSTSISTAINEAARKLFGRLEDPLRTQCRYAYAHAKIDARQERDQSVSPDLMERHDELEEELRQKGLDPAQMHQRLFSH